MASGVFKATELWTECVLEFQRGVPLSKHRVYFKSYENSFVASEAVSWFHGRLSEKFDGSINRNQALLLMKKFYKAGVFRKVESVGEETQEESEFKDSSKVFRLGDHGTLREEVEKTDNYEVEIVPVTPEQIRLISIDVFQKRFNDLTKIDLDPVLIQNLELKVLKDEVLPGWLISAMETLVTWPLKRSLSMISYPSFETDVFKLILDYFKSYGKDKFIRDRLSELFVKCFVHSEMVDFNGRSLGLQRIETYPYAHSESVEDLLKHIGTPICTGGVRRKVGLGIPRRIFEECEASPVSVGVSPMDQNSYSLDRYTKTIEYFETAFLNESPVTRTLQAAGQGQCNGYANEGLTLSPYDLINHPKYDRINRRIGMMKRKKSYSSVDLTSPEQFGRIANSNGLDYYYGKGKQAAGLLTMEGKRLGVEMFRLLVLLLPGIERKHLEVLLRFMKKLSSSKVMLDVAVSNRAMLLTEFTPILLKSTENLLSSRIISFLMDNMEEIFKESINTEIEEKIKEKQIRKVKIDNKENLSYCSKISLDEWEGQRLLGDTGKSLRELLGVILKMEDGAKKRKLLKKFEKEYPHIYSEKFDVSAAKKEKKSILKAIF